MRLVLLSSLAALYLFTGCSAPQPPLYYYGDYSERYYMYKREPGAESTRALMQSLEDAIAKASQSRSKRVPPGMYANLGYLYLQNGDTARARTLFENEKRLYGESAHFMDRVIAKIDAKEAEK